MNLRPEISNLHVIKWLAGAHICVLDPTYATVLLLEVTLAFPSSQCSAFQCASPSYVSTDGFTNTVMSFLCSLFSLQSYM